MMFTLFLSIILIFVPQIAHSPAALEPAAPEENIFSKVEERVLETAIQKEGDSPISGLPRAAPRGPQKKEESKSLGIVTTARAALVFDEATGSILFEKDSREKLSLASLTKLMTALVFLETNPDWDRKINLNKADEKEGGIFYARAPEEVKIKDLFNMMLVGSVNNAAMAITRSTGMGEDEFVAKMNEKAKALNLEDTFFVDPTGLLTGNMGTAYDVAKMLSYALENDKIKEAVLRKRYVFSPGRSQKVYYVKSTDELLWSFLNESPYEIVGGKTGYIEEAGYNLAVEFEKDEHKIIVVVLGSATAGNRFQEVKGLTVWAFENYNW